MDVVIVGAGTFGASLAWQLARGGHEVDARRPVRARRPAGDVRRRDAADPLLARRRRGLHGDGAPRADAVARARGASPARTCWSSAASRGSRTARTAGRRRPSARWWRRASRPSAMRSRPLFPSFRRRRPDVHAARARGGRAAGAARGAGARRAGRRPRRHDHRGRARSRTAPRRGSTTARGSKATPSSGPAAAGSRGSSPTLVTLKVTRQELLFLDGGPAWREPGVPGVGRLRPRDVRHRRPRRARREGGARPRGPAARPRRRARGHADDRAGGARVHAPPLPRARARPARARHARAATSSRPTRTSSPHRIPSTPACGCSAAAPATGSSTARRWPSGSPRRWPAASRSRTASRSASASPREQPAHGRFGCG